ncbi:uncharacterized protein ASPGLDRAFT_850810 [Aspergillus glaucus CBS 516.65]|uniref:Uncharacterized protein n=1 Tax=Aspergillus glaucus CBS 516.65 TaxID=1160497 RepID=A0A1L9V9E1_ASPGL|nr:hypothetical protein ASPGLDRAFT_850810 [Aspergillus glaucus CBS 516.65]OJJ80541.1 hypothetical protein ASPGLDRAFT_850810 [Aspergillus glaucus CBS 516.65]
MVPAGSHPQSFRHAHHLLSLVYNECRTLHLPPPQPFLGLAHEYITLLYQQPSNHTFSTCLDSVVQSTKGRFRFNLEDFVKDAGLDEPVAVNWFRIQNPTPASTSYAITSTLITTYSCSATVTATS